MKLSELASSVAIEWGLSDNYVTIHRLKLHIIGARATVIQRRYDQSKRFPQSLVMTVRCTDFKQVERTECICILDGKKAVRTVNKVPKPLLVKDSTTFEFVGSANLQESFTELLPSEIQLAEHRRFSLNVIFYSYFDDYLYILNAPSFKEGGLRYVPENPLELLVFGQCDEHECIDDDDLIIEGSLEENILALLSKRKPMILNDSEIEIAG